MRLASRPWQRLAWRVAAVAFGVAVCVALVSALAHLDWSVVGELLARRDRGLIALALAGALVTAAGGLVFGMLSWRAVLLDLGPPVSGMRVVRVFFLTFLAKWVPGKVPGLVAGLKIAQVNGITVSRTISVGVLNQILVVLTGFAVGILAGVDVLDAGAWWLAAAAVPVALMMHRPDLTVNRAARLAMRLLRRPAPAAAASPRGMRHAVGWQCLAWLVVGSHLWLMALAMGAPPLRSFVLCVGAFSLATAAGMASVVAPDGIGVREAVLTAALVTVLPAPAAAVVALASRVVTTIGEVALALTLLGVTELRHRRRSRRHATPSEPDEDSDRSEGDAHDWEEPERVVHNR